MKEQERKKAGERKKAQEREKAEEREKVEEFLEKAKGLGSVLGLLNMERLMEELGNIQEELSIVHIAGTNGKGSTGAFLEAALMSAGYRVGRYSSPAVFSEEEKYQVDGRAISSEELLEVFGKLQKACLNMEEKGLPHPTLFEIETAAAFLWFYRMKCQIVLLETGLGGRLDATNVIRKPLCSVITSISMDHMKILGDTLIEIAREKAGIIKEGRPVVTAYQKPEVFSVLTDTCKNKCSDLIFPSKEIKNLRYEGDFLVFDWENYPGLALSLLGAYQPENAVCALLTLRCLKGQGYAVSEENIRRGFRTACWPGRFQVVSKTPLMILDGAHNTDAAKKLRKTLELGFTNRKIIYIIGVLADKEHGKILQRLLPLAHSVYAVTPNNPRALSGEELCQEARQYHKKVVYAPTVGQALAWAAKEAAAINRGVKDGPPGRADTESAKDGPAMVLAFGSLSWLGEMRREMEAMDYGR